ncbi:MAG: helix-turn-helix domain-containing protein [Kiritimatiellae bacterium]|nr:helix-turn-helix domain-containing protein [Kiritimatiellia bacterium]
METDTSKTLPYSLYFGENQFPIVVRRMAGGGKRVPVHDHEFSELVIVTKGWVEHEIGGESARLSRGDFFVLHPGQRHSYPKTSADSELYNLLYDAKVPIPMLALSGFSFVDFVYPPADRAEENPFSGVVARLPAKPLKEARELLEAMVRERREPGSASSLFLGSLFSSVVILLARETVGVVPPARSDWRLGGVVNYMQCHLAERLRVDKLARLAAMSQSTLLRAFKDAFGCGPAKYFASLRLSRAVELFRTTNLTVGEVAWKTGFFDESHLRKKIAQNLHTSIAALRGKKSAKG